MTICRICLRQAPSLSFRRRPSMRALSTTIERAARGKAEAKAASAAEAAKTPQTPALSKPIKSKAPKTSPTVALSSCPGGTILTGLNYIKGKEDPVAMEDSEYPAWLWTCLRTSRDEKQLDIVGAEDGDEYSKSLKQRRIAAKKKRKLEEKILASGDLTRLAPKIPLTHQSINLPSNEEATTDGAIQTLESMEQLRRALRRDRKAKIKENNYLKSM